MLLDDMVTTQEPPQPGHFLGRPNELMNRSTNADHLSSRLQAGRALVQVSTVSRRVSSQAGRSPRARSVCERTGRPESSRIASLE
eukprot:COSAG02_NODE_645_length_18947_cov_517.858712_14_plen_85_part_00